MAAAEFTLFITTNCLVNNAVRNGLVDQGCPTSDDLLGCSDYGMKAISKRMLAPGGILPGRGATAGRANRGITVSYLAEKNLRKACVFRNYIHHIQRTFVALTATLVLVEEAWDNRFDLENPIGDADREDVRDPAPMLKTDDIKKTLEDIDNVLNK